MNERFDVIVTILELIGTSAFAASGALTAIKRRFDLFGVIIIGVTTAVGGGIMRDIVIGSHPVAAFRDPLAMSAAALISVLVFAALAVKGDLGGKALKLYDTAMLMLDTIGLGIFTVTGITAAMRSGVSDNTFLLVFSGVITGVGGGVLRDIFVNKKPEIFVGNIYACASATGAAAFLLCYGMMSFMPACMVSLAVTFSLRLMSVKFGWNLPKIQIKARQERRIAATKENLINKKGASTMKKFIITISREFGCNAREVARKAAAELGVEFYDKDLVDMAAERAGISRDSFLDSEEMLDKNADRLLKSFGYGSSTQFYSDKAVKAQVDIIRDLANKRVSAIFFGRCADYVLREYPNHMNVFLYAPLEARIKHMCETYDLSWPEADKLIKRVDRQRHNYYKYVTGKNRGDRDNKHLMIDVSEYGTDLTAEMICFAAIKMFED